MPQNFYELVWIFIIYAFFGWCTEVSYAALDTGKFVNRGFLNGPYCPIYGCGIVIVVTILTPLKENLLLLFVGSVLLTTTLEFLTGYILEKAFHNKWWDYSDKPFNVKGYICLKFSILWGLACTFVMEILHPAIYKLITWIPFLPGVILLIILMGIFAVDCCITVSTILKFNRHLKIMEDLAASIHRLSDEIGENIYENVSDILERSEQFQEDHAQFIEKITETTETTRTRISQTTEAARVRLLDVRGEKQRQLLELREKYERLFAEKNKGFHRLLRAFPDMKSRDNNEILEKYKLRIHVYKKIKGKEKKNDTDNFNGSGDRAD